MIGATAFLLALAALAQLTEAGVGCGRVQPGLTSRGKRGTRSRLRIINGIYSTDTGVDPWVISQNYIDGGKQVFCGGSLIRVSDTIEASDIVLTAAHCATNKSIPSAPTPRRLPWLLRAGVFWQDSLAGGGQERKVVSYLKHPYYDENANFFNDIMLLKLDTPITFTDRIRPICLPAASEPLPLGKRCSVCGWGKNETIGTQPIALKKVFVDVYDDNTCFNNWGFGDEYYSYKKICTYASIDMDKYGYSTTCQGDSGGALVCQASDGSWIQYGIVSFGPQFCDNDSYYPIHTRVTSHLDFIQNGIRQLSSIASG